MKNALFETHSIRSGSFEELNEIATGWDQHFDQMTPGRFHGGVDLLQLGQTQILRECWSVKYRYQGSTPAGSIGFVLPLHEIGIASWVGASTCHNTVIMHAAVKEATLISGCAWDSLVLAIPEHDVAEKLFNCVGNVPLELDCHCAVTLPEVAANDLRHMGLDLLEKAKSSDGLEREEIDMRFKQFVDSFLWHVACASSAKIVIDAPAKTHRIVNRATELVLENPSYTVGLEEIAKQVGTSLRALHYAFQSETGMSSATWLRRLRLNQVHKALLKSSPDDILVKQVALDHGFLHTGHFSDQYHRMFGCLPSATLYSKEFDRLPE